MQQNFQKFLNPEKDKKEKEKKDEISDKQKRRTFDLTKNELGREDIPLDTSGTLIEGLEAKIPDRIALTFGAYSPTFQLFQMLVKLIFGLIFLMNWF